METKGKNYLPPAKVYFGRQNLFNKNFHDVVSKLKNNETHDDEKAD